MCENGRSVVQVLRQAADVNLQAHCGGEHKASYSMGSMFMKARAVAQDFCGARDLLERVHRTEESQTTCAWRINL